MRWKPCFFEYTESLRGTKANTNAAQGLGEMLEIAFNGEVTPNKKLKHEIDGANGWYHSPAVQAFSLSLHQC